jgi:hypothetical protein
MPSENYGVIPQSLLVPYSVIQINEIEKSMYVCIKNVKELFATSEDNAITLLKMYKWNEDKLQQDYFANDKAVLQKCGLVHDPKAAIEGSKTDCLICFNSLQGQGLISCYVIMCFAVIVGDCM